MLRNVPFKKIFDIFQKDLEERRYKNYKQNTKKRACTWEKKEYSTCIVGFCIIWSYVGNKHLTMERESLFLLRQMRAAISGSQFPKQTLDQEAPECNLPALFPPKPRESHLNLNTWMVSSEVDNQEKQTQPKSQPPHLQPLQHQGEIQVFLKVPWIHCLSPW